MKRIMKQSSNIKNISKAVAMGIVVTLAGTFNAIAETGITKDKIVIGGVMDLEGRSRALGQGMRQGILAALSGKRVKGRVLEYITLNDSYNPTKTKAATEELVENDGRVDE